MKRMLVRYKTKPEAAEENARLIEAVFRELQARSPAGLRYHVVRLADGTFFHFVEYEGDASPLPGLDAFRAFQAGIKQRCLEPPLAADAEIVGRYGR